MKSQLLNIMLILFVFITPSCNKETCDDGIQNQTETDIDCGGTCSACETCDDGILNQDETDIDCGGACEACAIVLAPCVQSSNTANFPFGFQDDSYSIYCSTDSRGFEILGNGSQSDMTVFFNIDGPFSNKVYLTTNSINQSFLSSDQVVITTVAGEPFTQRYYADKDQNVYVNVTCSVVTVEFCGLTFNSGGSSVVTDLVVSASLKCE